MAGFRGITDITLNADGVTIGDSSGSTNKTILGMSWGSGRSDWFASLAPSSASFTLLGDQTASVACGDSLVLAKGSTALFTGKVDTVTLDQVQGQPDTTTVTGADFVAQLGEAKLKAQNISLDLFHEQLSDVLGFADITATVSLSPAVADDGQLDAWTAYTGSVLDWINTAERYANAIVTVNGAGDILVCTRDRLPDYGERVFNDAGGGIGITNASSLWRMDESSGDIIDVANTRDGTAAGTPTYGQTGPWGSDGPDAIGFTKADAADQFTIGDSFDLADANTTTWTLAGWVYWSGAAGSNSCIMSKVTGGNGWTMTVLTSGRLRFQAFNASAVVVDAQSASGAIVANTWTHVAVVRSGSSVWTVINGTFGSAATVSGTIPNTAASLRIGSNAGSAEWFDGRLCMLSVWASSLTQAQIQRLIDLDHVELPSPRSWVEARSITSVINHWLIGGVTTKKTTSVNTYGRRTWDVDDTKEISGDVYSSDLMDVMADPRPIITATFDVLDDSSVLIDIAPLTLALYDGTLYQVLQVQHDVAPDRWQVTLTLDRTQNDMTGAGPVLPV